MIKFKKKDFIYLISREIKMLPLVGFSLVFRLLPNLWIILLLSSFFGHWSLDRIQKFWNLLVDDSKIPNKPMPGLCWNCSVQGNVPFLFSFFFFFFWEGEEGVLRYCSGASKGVRSWKLCFLQISGAASICLAVLFASCRFVSVFASFKGGGLRKSCARIYVHWRICLSPCAILFLFSNGFFIFSN